MEHYNPYENIANAIVIQACKDYRRAYRRYLRRYRSTGTPDAELAELEAFFRSAWYRSLTALDGEYTVYTGHNRSTTLSEERVRNRYLRKIPRGEL